MKTKEELMALKAEVEELSKKLAELSKEELNEVSGGTPIPHLVPSSDNPGSGGFIYASATPVAFGDNSTMNFNSSYIESNGSHGITAHDYGAEIYFYSNNN